MQEDDDFNQEANRLLDFADELIADLFSRIGLDPKQLTPDVVDALEFIQSNLGAQLSWEEIAHGYDGDRASFESAEKLFVGFSLIGIGALLDLATAADAFEWSREELFTVDPEFRDQGMAFYWLADGLAACASVQRVLGNALGRIELAQKAATARHAENHALRAELRAYFKAHRADFTSLDDAAEKLAGKIFPVKFRTARKWLTGLGSANVTDESP